MEREREFISEWMYEITPTTRATMQKLLEGADLAIDRREAHPEILPVHLLDTDHVELARGILLGREENRLLVETPLRPMTGALLRIEARTRQRVYLGRVQDIHAACRAQDPSGQFILALSVESAWSSDPRNGQPNG
ncbi:MAG: hypothetical protein ACP5DC_02000 [Halothiobacillaceae bacterium]